MGENKSCLKKCFICLNVILGLTGLIVFTLLILAHIRSQDTKEESNSTETLDQVLGSEAGDYQIWRTNQVQKSVKGGFAMFYAISFLAILLSILGVYSACTEKKWALIAFLTMAILGCVGLLVVGVPFQSSTSMVYSALANYMTSVSPLATASKNDQQIAEFLQSELHCCGYVDGHTTWGSKIPDSCLCPTDWPAKCVTVDMPKRPYSPAGPVSSDDVRKSVYKETCYPILLDIIWAGFSMLLAIIFGFFALVLLLAVLCMVILYQMRTQRPPSRPVVFMR